jgi:hypothetical protein
MNRILMIFAGIVLGAIALLAAQGSPQATSPPAQSADYSGMYTFLKEGEFVQLTVEDGRVTGFVSRYGDQESDQGTFLDQFFKEAKLEGRKLTFTTQTVHGVWYEFKGSVDRGAGKNVGDEAYYVLKGKLTEHKVGADNKTPMKAQDVVFKAFPANLDTPNQP